MYKFLAVLFGVFMIMPAHAEDSKTHSYKLGAFEVTSLINQKAEHDKSLFHYGDSEKLKELLSENDANLGSMGEFYVDTGSRKILFDTGLSSKTSELLESINVQPKDIDMVIITHTHGDHVGGLLDSAGRQNFPNAVIYVSEEELAANPDNPKLAAYGEKVKTFGRFEKIIEGIVSEPAFGHTLGHTVFWLESEGRKMLIWGDVIHAQIQFMYPEIYLRYDTNHLDALDVRNDLLKRVADEDVVVGGMHLAAPAMGRVYKEDIGYRFEPIK
ncbi:MAG: MBL fold metallo-hydrolase [Lactobacillaceae bacterium]|jgi:glyoxylase-like metal-dependent hydrolase (beta-lactamase superfamily II)|nr:MBL fold metallo-hydrolase [Lactobacillaceae bacterium]